MPVTFKFACIPSCPGSKGKSKKTVYISSFAGAAFPSNLFLPFATFFLQIAWHSVDFPHKN